MSLFSAVFNLTDLDGANGSRLDGVRYGDRAGSAVSSAGDVNEDGIADLLVGAAEADPNGESNWKSTYVVFCGGSFTTIEPFPATFSLASLDGANGFSFDGLSADDRSGGASFGDKLIVNNSAGLETIASNNNTQIIFSGHAPIADYSTALQYVSYGNTLFFNGNQLTGNAAQATRNESLRLIATDSANNPASLPWGVIGAVVSTGIAGLLAILFTYRNRDRISATLSSLSKNRYGHFNGNSTQQTEEFIEEFDGVNAGMEDIDIASTSLPRLSNTTDV